MTHPRYDWAHRRLRARLAPAVNRGEATCWRCDQPIHPGQPWDLGHDDDHDGAYRGPEHQACNRAAGSRKRHAKPANEPLGNRSRDW